MKRAEASRKALQDFRAKKQVLHELGEQNASVLRAQKKRAHQDEADEEQKVADAQAIADERDVST
eukprot:m.155275 g.155275  ORF g.155275 m.155275 type:complete len:65 (+) comp9797_c0_seq17:1243-1437(+)